MTGRVCPVHGEYSPTGVCRWCEAELPRVDVVTQRNPAPDAPVWQAKIKDMISCRCGEYAWFPECASDMREGVLGGVFHSPAQCFKLGAEPPGTERVLVEFVDDGPFRPPMIVEWRIRTEPERTEAVIDAETHAAEQSRLASEHAALRWERVARRWNYKHRSQNGLDEEGRATVWRYWVAMQVPP